MKNTGGSKADFLAIITLILLAMSFLANCQGSNNINGANHTYMVTYDGNGNTGGSAPIDTTNYGAGQTVTVLGNIGNLVKTGYSFVGWNMQADGNGNTYAQDQTFVMRSANVALFAKWMANPTFTVTYDGNGNTSGSVPIDSTNYEQGQTVTVLGNTGNLMNGVYPFSGWNTQADGNGTTYWQGSTFTIGSANVTLFAMWTERFSPLPNAEAEQLSIEATGSLTAPLTVYNRVVTELDSIRAVYSSTVNITAMPSWNFQQLIVGFNDTAKTAVMDGTYSAWNALNNTYGVTQIDKSLLDRFGTVLLRFFGRYNIPLLVPEYAGLPGARYAEPNGVFGYANDVCLSIDGTNHFFIFAAGSGDCLAGCTQYAYQGFVVGEKGGITELGTWDTSSRSPAPAWLTKLSACMTWL
jgi:uncharacterized repeat protein (TIGR02543 family)